MTGIPICEPSFPRILSTLEQSACAGFRFFRGPFLIPDVGGQFSILSLGKSYVFDCNSLTGSPIWEPSVPTSDSILGRSVRASF